MDNDAADLVLDRPTIADLITFLQAYPPETKIIINDADTNWGITKFHIDYFQVEETMKIYGLYDEME